MLSKRAEEKHEKIIRGLMKLPFNRNCINCNNVGPQYVCTNFSTFVCITCSGIHREFTHRVKSVSMAKFTTEEIEALQRGGNQHARDVFLKDFDTRRMRFLDNRKVDKIRDFINDVYIHKKYAGGRSSDKSFKDKERLNNREEDERRSSSFHSCTESPPSEHKHNDKHHGRKGTNMNRWPRSDHRLHRGNIPNSVQSPGHIPESIHDAKLSTISSGLRYFDYPLSSIGDTSILDIQTPKFQNNVYSTQNLHQARDISNEKSDIFYNASAERDFDWFSCRERNSSVDSFVSLDSSPDSIFTNSRSESFKTASSKSVMDPEDFTGAEQEETFTIFPSQLSLCRNVKEEEQEATPLTPPVDLFADFSNQTSSIAPNEQNKIAVSFSCNEGWVTFDVSEPVGFVSQVNTEVSSMLTRSDEASKATENVLAPTNDSQRSSSQSSLFSIPFTSTSEQWDLDMGLHQDIIRSSDPNSYQVSSQSSLFSIPFTSRSEQMDLDTGLHQDSDQNSYQRTHTIHCSGVYRMIICYKFRRIQSAYYDRPIGLKTSEDFCNNGYHNSVLHDLFPAFDLSPNGVSSSSFFLPALRQTVGAVHLQKSVNPFDLLNDLAEANNVVCDMNSLQTALPYPEVPSFLDEPQWFPLTQGGLAGIEGPATSFNLSNLPPQGSAPFFGGNPFA